MTTILIIPDSHAKPGVSNERYDWLARLMLDRRPDVVIDLGDFADMESLSSYDHGKLSGQNRNVGRDIDWAIDARRRLTDPLRALQRRQGKNKKKLYAPRLIALGGNHEARVDRYVNDHPELAGLLNQDVSQAAQQGWEWYPFLTPVTVLGITCCHYFHNQMGKPIGGVNLARILLQKLYTSAICGHSHIWNHYSDVDITGKRLHGLVAGCYFGHEEPYAKQSNARWERCLTLLHEVENGDYTLEKLRYERVRLEYGEGC